MIKKCSRCRWWKNEYNINCLSFWGNPNADIVFVGEAFGAEERDNYLKTGIAEPFVGKAGQIFENLLKMIGIKKSDIAIMNCMRCYDSNNSTPVKKEIDACFINSLKDIASIKPKLVVALGASALYLTLGREGITNYRGKLFFSNKVNCNVFTTWHPAAIIYTASRKATLVEDFKKIPVLVNKTQHPTKHYEYIYIDTVEKFDRAFEILNAEEILFFDIESTGLDYINDRITLLQLGTFQEPEFLIDPSIFDLVSDRLKHLFKTKKFIGQGFEFDAKFLSRHGWWIENWFFDTCLGEFNISGFKNNDLTTLTFKYVPESAGYDDDVKLAGGAHLIKDIKKFKQYGSDDIGVLPKIYEKEYDQLKNENRLWLFDNIIMPCNKVLTKMSLRGVKYDLDKLMEVDKSIERKANRLLVKAHNLDSVKETERHFGQKFNPSSTNHIRYMLIEVDNLPILKKTKGKQASTSKKEMEIYSKPPHNNKYCQIMEQYRSLQTIRSNFLSGVIPKLNDGIAHTRYSLHATTTGRPNSKDPNLLNIPRIKEVKQCIVARDGYSFLYGDEAQIEVRVGAVVYAEPKLIGICNDLSKDFHSNITSKAFRRPYDEIYNGYKNGDKNITELRVKGKAVTFGVFYQQGAEALAYSLGISVKEAEQFIYEYYLGFPNLSKNIDKVKELVRKQRWLENYFRFKRAWPAPKSDEKESVIEAYVREGVNFLVQSCAWNLVQLAMIQLDKALDKYGNNAYLILQVYDAIVVECKDELIQTLTPVMKNIMETVGEQFKLLKQVKFKTDIEVGKNLGDMHKLEI